jgi:hypothetical protein
MTTVHLPMIARLLAPRRSTLPLGPHFDDPEERAILARALRTARQKVLASPARRHRQTRGYHVRQEASRLLQSHPELQVRVWLCPVWRGRTATDREARELSTDGPLTEET